MADVINFNDVKEKKEEEQENKELVEAPVDRGERHGDVTDVFLDLADRSAEGEVHSFYGLFQKDDGTIGFVMGEPHPEDVLHILGGLEYLRFKVLASVANDDE